MRHGSPRSRQAAAAVSFVVVFFALGAQRASAVGNQSSSSVGSAQQLQALQQQVAGLESKVNDQSTELIVALSLIGAIFLVSTGLSTAGFIFSEQRARSAENRAVESHDLAIQGETAAQKRTDDSYESFLQTSQRTLGLVNDTLELAREATDRAAHMMERRATSSLNAIERRAEGLLLGIFERGNFREVVESAECRSSVHGLAAELSRIEGYLLLQEIQLPPYCQFVAGIHSYLEDDTERALDALRHLAQDPTHPQLQRFALYWAGDLNRDLGAYSAANHQFQLAQEHLSWESNEAFELRRIIIETEFFDIAQTVAPFPPDESKPSPDARSKLEAVKHLMVQLEALAGQWWKQEHQTTATTSHDIAITRADILTWIAYRPENLFERFSTGDCGVAKMASGELASHPDHADEFRTAEAAAVIVPIDVADSSPQWKALPDAALRAWALQQARALYDFERVGEADFSLLFGQAECHFALQESEDVLLYTNVARKAMEGLRSHREPRKTVELAQILLVCRGRLLAHYLKTEPIKARSEVTEVTDAYGQVLATMRDIADQQRMTIFSQVQKRNVSQEEFEAEARRFEAQALALVGPGT